MPSIKIRHSLIIPFGLTLIPALILAVFLLGNSVNLPYYDQWWTPGVAIANWADGTLYLPHLVQQHNEHRMLFPRLWFMGLATITHWDVRYEMLSTFGLAVLVSVNCFLLSRRTIAISMGSSLAIAFLANLLIFAPIQWETWLWGIQMTALVPIACLSLGLLICTSSLRFGIQLWLNLLLATLSFFSFGNGILYWMLMPFALFPQQLNSQFYRRWQVWLIWWTAFLANCLFYFWNFKTPPQNPSLFAAFLNPLEAIRYFFAFLGAPLAFGSQIPSLNLAIAIGITLVSLFGICIFYIWQKRLFESARVWLMFSGYALLTAAISTITRVGYGAEQATLSRYSSLSIYFMVGLIHLLPLVVREISNRQQKRNFSYALISLASALFILHGQTSWQGVQAMQALRANHLQGKACLIVSGIAFDRSCIRKYLHHDMNIDKLKGLISTIDRIGYLQPPLLKSANLNEIAVVDQQNHGYFDQLVKSLNQNAEQDITLNGWAILRSRRELADGILLAYDNSQGEPQLFAIASERMPREDVKQSTKQEIYLRSGWQYTFKRSQLPNGKLKLTAWAFDALQSRAYQLQGSQLLD